MGQHFQFRCDGCGYEAEASGGPDVGMAVATQTIACAKCKELVDVVTSKWKAGGPCPRCGEKMRTGGLTALWD